MRREDSRLIEVIYSFALFLISYINQGPEKIKLYL